MTPVERLINDSTVSDVDICSPDCVMVPVYSEHRIGLLGTKQQVVVGHVAISKDSILYGFIGDGGVLKVEE